MAIENNDIVDQMEGGGENPPSGYKPLSVAQRTQWNGFLDALSKQKGANPSDFLNQYRQANPGFSITPDQLPYIQYEAQQLRTGNSFGNLNADQLKSLRQGLTPAFLGQTDLYKSYYPQIKRGSTDFGTDLEGYVNSANAPATAPKPSNSIAPAPAGGIARPDYNNPASRLAYAQQWDKKYGVEEGYGDIPLRANEVPLGGTDTAKNLAVKAGNKVGIDPALLYSSAMVEGMSGTFHNQTGSMAGKIMKSNDPDYPVLGAASYGLNNFVSRVPEMIKKGYLPADFADKYKEWHPTDEKNKNVQDSALFKTADDALTATGARLKLDYDEIDDHANKEGIKLSPQARDFFALANYNSGLGKQMMDKYSKNGWLQGDKWMQGNPDGSYPEVYKHAILRIKERNALKGENIF